MTERKRKNKNNGSAACEANAMSTTPAAFMENAASALNEAHMHSPQLENIVLTLIWAGGQAGHCGRAEKVQVKEAEGPEGTEISREPEGYAHGNSKGSTPDCESEVIESVADVNETAESTGTDSEPDTEPENTIEMEEFRRRSSKRSQYWSHNRTYWLREAEAKLEKVFPMCSIASRQEFICKLQLVPGLLEYCCAAIYDHFGSEPFSMIRAAEEMQQGETPIAAGSSDDASAAGREEAAR